MRPLLPLFVTTAFVLGACGDDATSGDASPDVIGGDDATTDAGAVVAPAATPEPPRLTPCPEGWREVDSGEGFGFCEPWPSSGFADCPFGEAHFPGTPGCAPLGSACPADGLPDDLPADRPALFVSAGATGGDGSRASPFGTIAAALAVATAGDVVAVGVGAYEEEVVVPEGIAVIGACVSGAVLTAAAPRTDAGVITVGGSDVEIANLSIESSPRPGIWAVGEGVSAVVRDVAVRGAQIAGISVELGATLDAERIAVRDVRAAPLFPLGRGVNVETDATASVRWADLRDNTEFGAFAFSGGRLTLSDSVVAGTRPSAPERNGGPGLAAFDGGTLDAIRVVIRDNQQVGVVALDGSTITIEDAVIRDTQPWGAAGTGRGVDVESGSTFSCTRCTIDRSRDIGLGFGGSMATLTDVFVRETLPAAEGDFGRGVAVQFDADVSLSRVTVVDSYEHGLLVLASHVQMNDVTLRRVLPQRVDQEFGRGLGVEQGGSAVLSRVEIDEVHEAGIVVTDEGTTFDATDLRVHDVASRPSGFFGRGIIVQNMASVEVLRGRIEDVREVGVMSIFESRVNLEDVSVVGVLPQECADEACDTFPGGHGLGSYATSSIVTERFAVEDVSLCGMHVTDASTIVATAGLVTGAAIGVCLQSEGQELGEVSNDVLYRDNGINFDSPELPVPEAVGAAE